MSVESGLRGPPPRRGPHPTISSLHVFNGLGTRGVLIGPRWSHHLGDSLVGKAQLPDIVNPARLLCSFANFIFSLKCPVETSGLEEFSAAANFFLEEWPAILKPWGFTRTAGLIHGTLLIHSTPLTADEILASTGASRGGVSTQLNILHQAGLIERMRILGERQERFTPIRDGRLQGALLAHFEQQTLWPMKLLEHTLTAIAGKEDNPWLGALHDLGQNET